MEFIKTSVQVTQAVKNVGRLRTILGTFARHGFQEVGVRIGLSNYIPSISKKEGVENLTIPERLRMSFEDLGPTFIKLGQMLSNRPDIIPEEYIEEFKKLQDNVTPAPFEQIRDVIESEIKSQISQVFASFNETPIACASIGQVYEATLKTVQSLQ